MQCLNCGLENVPGMHQCARCQSALDLAAISVQPPRRSQSLLARLTYGWTRRALSPADRIRLAAWGRQIARYLPNSKWLRYAWWILVPGTAPIAMGYRKLGLGLLLAWLAAVLLAILTAGSSVAALAYMGAISIHATSIGVLLGRFRLGNRLAVRILTGLLLFAALHLFLYGPLSRSFVQAVPISNIATAPNLRNGDIVLCRGRVLRQECRLGDMVAYGLDGHGLGGLGMDRIVGLPGDRICIRDGQLLVNGMAPAPGPLGPVKDWPDISEVTARPDEVLIFPSLLRLHVAGQGRSQLPRLFDSVVRVKKSAVVGRAVCRSWPPNRWGKVE